jgi:hypothetical protein
VFIWYIFSGFGIMHQEKSGNPEVNPSGVVSGLVHNFVIKMQK